MCERGTFCAAVETGCGVHAVRKVAEEQGVLFEDGAKLLAVMSIKLGASESEGACRLRQRIPTIHSSKLRHELDCTPAMRWIDRF